MAIAVAVRKEREARQQLAVRQEREARQQSAQSTAQRMKEIASKREETIAANKDKERSQTLATEQVTTTQGGRRVVTVTHT
jgi:hypothetical protein